MAEQPWLEDYDTEELVRAHENSLYRTALAIIGNKADAEDIVQEAFVRFLEKGPAFQSHEHAKAWLIRVAINLCRSRLRSAWWRKTVPLLDSYPAASEEQHYLVQTILQLPMKQRIVVYLFYYEGYSTREIARITEQKESTVRSQLTRARQKLKSIIEEDCL